VAQRKSVIITVTASAGAIEPDPAALDPALVNGQTGLTGPIERPSGWPIWAHQGSIDHAPQVAFDAARHDEHDLHSGMLFDHNPASIQHQPAAEVPSWISTQDPNRSGL